MSDYIVLLMSLRMKSEKYKERAALKSEAAEGALHALNR